MTTAVVQPQPLKSVVSRHPLRRLISTPTSVLGLIWVVFIAIASITAPLWVPYSTTQQDLSIALAGPSSAHWLGTDELGRDVLSRLFVAGAQTLGTALITVAVSMIIGVTLALWAASSGDRTEAVINRSTEVVMSIPGTVIILAVIGAVGTNMPLVMAILGLLLAAGMYRVFVGQAKSVQKQPYIEAARVDGLGAVRISAVHVLPGLLGTILVQAALVFAIGILVQAGLAFIGFGPPIPQPSWGGMIQSASQHIYQDPWLLVPTGLALSLTVLSVNAVADVLADAGSRPPLQVVLRSRRTRAMGNSLESTGADFDLVVSNVSIGLKGGGPLVSSLSFTVPRGRVVGLVGESGCGKTVTALSILGLLPPGVELSGGSVGWHGQNLAGLDERELATLRGREIALVSQEPMRALDPMFTIGYQLGGAIRRLRGASRFEARTEASALLSRVGIADPKRVLSSYPHQISGGMAQRVAIALALSGNPKLLIADEPTTALDVTVQAEILSLLRSLVADTGMSLVIVTHDLGVVADICETVIVMYAGQIVEEGDMTSVLTQAEHPYTMALLASDPHTGAVSTQRNRLATIAGQVPKPSDWPGGCRFVERCRFATKACTVAVPLASRTTGEGEVRCIRATELATTHVRWEDAQPRVTSTVRIQLGARNE